MVQQWIFKVMIKKVTKRLVTLVVAYLVSINLSNFGVTIDQNQLTLGLFALIEGLKNYVKVKFSLNWL